MRKMKDRRKLRKRAYRSGLAAVMVAAMIGQSAGAVTALADDTVAQSQVESSVQSSSVASSSQTSQSSRSSQSQSNQSQTSQGSQSSQTSQSQFSQTQTSQSDSSTGSTSASSSAGTNANSRAKSSAQTSTSNDSLTNLGNKMPLTLKTEQISGKLTGGSSQSITLHVTNTSAKTMQGISFSVVSAISGLNIGDLSALGIDSLGAGETKTVSIPVEIASGLATGTSNGNLTVHCSYTCDGKSFTGKKKVSLSMNNTSSSDSTSEDASETIDAAEVNTSDGSESTVTASEDEEQDEDDSSSDTSYSVYSSDEEEDYWSDYSYSEDTGTYTSSASSVASKTPTLLVQSYSTGGKVQTGDSFSLQMQFLNTSKSITLENATITMEPSDGVTFENSSNIIYIDSLAAGATSDQTISMKALADAKDENQKLTLTMSYEYVDSGERKTAQSTVYLSFPVEQKDRMVFRDATYDNMQAGQEGSISVAVVNKGRGDIYNLEASLDLDGATAEQNTIYAGNYESGKEGSIDFIVTPENEGDYNGTIHITYEDKDQEVKTVDITVKFTAEAGMEESYTEDDMAYEDSDSAGTSVGIKAGAVGFAGLAAAAFALFRHKKKKSKVAEQVEEDDLDGWDSEE